MDSRNRETLIELLVAAFHEGRDGTDECRFLEAIEAIRVGHVRDLPQVVFDDDSLYDLTRRAVALAVLDA